MNEPNGMGKAPAASLARMALAVRAAGGSANEVLVGPTTSGIDTNYINATFVAGILPALTGVSLHPYRDSAPETALPEYDIVRSLIVQYAKPAQAQIPIYVGEWGYTSATLPCTYGNRVR